MQRKLTEDEYLFNKVEVPDREDCLNWELGRECYSRLFGRLPRNYKPWLEMNPNERAFARRHPWITFIKKKEPIWSVPYHHIRKEEVETQTGERFQTPEAVPLDFKLFMHWDRSDPQLLKEITDFFEGWLKQQRKTNPNARHFRAKPDSGRRKNVLQWLARLAVWRLHKFGGLNDLDIERKLRDLFGLLRLHGLTGNLSRWCADIDEILRKYPTIF